MASSVLLYIKQTSISTGSMCVCMQIVSTGKLDFGKLIIVLFFAACMRIRQPEAMLHVIYDVHGGL